MPLVEFIGPPTVGKSTLVEACVGPGFLDARRAVLEPRHPLLAPLAPLARTVSTPPILRGLAARVLAAPADARVEAALAAIPETWRPFLRLVLDGDTDQDGPSVTPAGTYVIALMERQWLLSALQLRALLEPERRSESILLLDEGLTHPYKARGVAGTRAHTVLEKYAECVPMPDILVVLDADTSVLVQRMRDRYDRMPERARWASLGQGDAERLTAELDAVRGSVRTIVSRLRARGCQIIEIDPLGGSTKSLALRLTGEIRALSRPGIARP